MANTRKRAIKEEPDTKKVARVKTEHTKSSKPTAKTAVKAESDLDSANSTDLNVLNGLTVQQPFASAIIFGVRFALMPQTILINGKLTLDIP